MHRVKALLNRSPRLRACVEALRPNPYFVADPRTPHLGGYRSGGDPNTLCDTVHEHFFDLGCRSAFDVGCAEGLTVQRLRNMGYDAWGLEGYAKALAKSPCPDRILIHDMTRSPFVGQTRFDLVWCAEVAEHIEERFTGNFVLTLAGNCGRFVAMTHAEPGQEGFHHVNCKPAPYWIHLMQAVGLDYQEELTAHCRQMMVRARPSSFFAKTGLVFSRPDSQSIAPAGREV